MEKIVKIEETNFTKKEGSWLSNYEGFVIATDKQLIKVGISSGQSCCENFGTLMSEDNLSEFEGAELFKIEVTDTALKTYEIDTEWGGGCMFVNFNTSNGLLQFVAYNEHNGYYGHEAIVISEQLNHSETL